MALPASSSPSSHLRACLLSALALWTTACSDSRLQPAQQAIADIEAAVAAAGTAPIKYIPGEVTQVQDDLEVLKQEFESEDYAAVLADAPPVLAAARALQPDAAAREAQLLQSLQQDWSTLEPAVPAEIEAMRSRLQRLAAGKTLPSGLSRDDLHGATRRVEDAQTLWQRALEERAARRLPEAVTLANQARELLARMAALPGLAAPDGPVK